MKITLSSLPQREGPQGTVIMGYGPQEMDWLSKASKLAGLGAVLDQDVARMAGATFACGAPEALAALRTRLEAGALEAAVAATQGISIQASKWLAGGERGTSSNTIFSHLLGVDATGFGGFDHPHDPADFRRCRLLLDQVPELRPLLPGMRSVSPAWSCLVDAWDSICATMDAEAPNWREARGWKVPKTYALIKTAVGR